MIGFGEAGTENCKLVICQPLMEMPSTAFETENSGWRGVALESSRVLLIDEGPPAGGGIAGDRVRLRRPLRGQAYEWLCTESHPSEAAWIPILEL